MGNLISVEGLILVLVSLALCSIGFKRFVWFMSIGYGVSAAGIGLTLFIMALVKGQANIIYLIHCLLFVVYGVRLGGFLLVRELKNEKYRAKLAEVGGDAKVPVFVAAFMWLYCGCSYVIQASGTVYRLLNGETAANAAAVIGLVIAAAGIIIEAVSDKQKSAQKAENPDMPAMKGLFKFCRCPNYFGEILFWTGSLVAAIGSVHGTQWIVVIIGYVLITGVMVSGAKRLETRHIKHYSKYPEYIEYADKTPILFPFVPFYHMTSPEKIEAEEKAKAAKAEAMKAKKAAKK